MKENAPMARMNGPKRKKIYRQLVQRDGEVCFIGGEPLNAERSVIDHLDNDNSNNEMSNLHLMCRSMNSVKNPRGKTKKSKVQSSVCMCAETGMDQYDRIRSNSAEFVKNQQAEPAFKHWLFVELVHHYRILLEEAINSGAAIARCSQETIKRYLKKETSKVRLYQLIEDNETKEIFIEFKPKWTGFRRKEEERKELDKQADNWKEAMKLELSATMRV